MRMTEERTKEVIHTLVYGVPYTPEIEETGYTKGFQVLESTDTAGYLGVEVASHEKASEPPPSFKRKRTTKMSEKVAQRAFQRLPEPIKALLAEAGYKKPRYFIVKHED